MSKRNNQEDIDDTDQRREGDELIIMVHAFKRERIISSYRSNEKEDYYGIKKSLM